TAVVREQDPTSKFPIHSAPETLRSVASKSSRPFCSRAPQVSSGERARPNQQIPHPFCPRDPRVSSQQVLPPILLQSPSGARLAYNNRSPSVHPRCSLRVPAVPAVARSIVAMEDVTPGRRR
ncbi:hypothetical protein O3P69_016186, partial [Scylla paramamosain]